MQNQIPAMQGFLFGKNTDAPTYEALKKRREIADMLAQQATGGTPRNMGEGINAVGQALASRYVDRKIAPQEDDERQRVVQQLMEIRGGLGPQGISPEAMTGLSGITENPYAPAGVEAVARSLMRRQASAPADQMAGMGPATMSSRDMPRISPEAPQDGGPFGWTDPGEIPPLPGEPDPAIPPHVPAQEQSGAQGMNAQIAAMQPPIPGREPMVGPAGPQVADSGEIATDAEPNPDVIKREQQAKYIGFWNRMDGAEPRLQEFEDILASPAQRAADGVPMFGNALVSDEYQQARRAADDWLMGILRIDTGATINPEELKRLERAYIPQAFDGEPMRKDKREARQRAMDGVKMGLGPAAILADELAMQREKSAAPATSGGGDWQSQDPSTWTEEQLREFTK